MSRRNNHLVAFKIALVILGDFYKLAGCALKRGKSIRPYSVGPKVLREEATFLESNPRCSAQISYTSDITTLDQVASFDLCRFQLGRPAGD